MRIWLSLIYTFFFILISFFSVVIVIVTFCLCIRLFRSYCTFKRQILLQHLFLTSVSFLCSAALIGNYSRLVFFFFFSWPTGGLDRKTRTRRKTSIFQHHKSKVASYRNDKHNRNKSETYFFKMQKQCLENGFFISKTFVTGN